MLVSGNAEEMDGDSLSRYKHGQLFEEPVPGNNNRKIIVFSC